MDGARVRLRPEPQTAAPASAPPAASPSRALTPATVLALQRTAGNAATARLLRDAQEPPAELEAPGDDAYSVAAAQADWPAAAAALATVDDERLRREARALAPDDRAALLAAVAPGDHRVRAALLDVSFDDAVAAGDWPAAAEALNGFSDTDIAERTAHLDADSLRQLLAAARVHPRLAGGGRIVTAGQGTAAAPGKGQLFGRIEIHQEIGSPGFPGGRYYSPVEIRFHPDPEVCDCDEIAFVQTVRTVATGTNESRQPPGKLRERLNADQEGVDRFHTQKQGWYGRSNSDENQEQMTPGNSLVPTPAVMSDHPSSTMPSTTWTFETAVIARTGPQANTVYATVRWGFVVDEVNAVTALPIAVEDRISPGFATAVDAWNRQAAGPEGGRTHPDQQRLPTFR